MKVLATKTNYKLTHITAMACILWSGVVQTFNRCVGGDLCIQMDSILILVSLKFNACVYPLITPVKNEQIICSSDNLHNLRLKEQKQSNFIKFDLLPVYTNYL